MRKIVCFLIITPLFNLFTVAALGQSAHRISGNVPSVDSEKQLKDEDYKDWRKIELRRFSFYVPPGLIQTDVKCVESGCYTFKVDSMVVGVDVNPDAYRPSYERKFASYKEKRFWVDEVNGIYAWQWSFEQERNQSEYQYHYGCLFIFENQKHYKVNFSVLSDTAAAEKIATGICRSVRFKTADGQ